MTNENKMLLLDYFYKSDHMLHMVEVGLSDVMDFIGIEEIDTGTKENIAKVVGIIGQLRLVIQEEVIRNGNQ